NVMSERVALHCSQPAPGRFAKLYTPGNVGAALGRRLRTRAFPNRTSMMRFRLARGRAACLAGLCLVALLAGSCGQNASDVEQLLAEAAQERAKGRSDAAIIHLKNLVQKAPENAEVRYQLGMAYLETGDFESAEKELRRALDLKYDPKRITVPLARALFGMGGFQKVLNETTTPAGADNG